MNGIYLYFVNKQLSTWPLLGPEALPYSIHVYQPEMINETFFKITLRFTSITISNTVSLFSMCSLDMLCKTITLLILNLIFQNTDTKGLVFFIFFFFCFFVFSSANAKAIKNFTGSRYVLKPFL